MQACTHTHTPSHTHTSTHTHTPTQTHLYTCQHKHTQTHARMYTPTHSRTYTRTHTHKQTHIHTEITTIGNCIHPIDSGRFTVVIDGAFHIWKSHFNQILILSKGLNASVNNALAARNETNNSKAKCEISTRSI